MAEVCRSRWAGSILVFNGRFRVRFGPLVSVGLKLANQRLLGHALPPDTMKKLLPLDPALDRYSQLSSSVTNSCRLVAQISNLLYPGFPIRKFSEFRAACRLEVGATADWKSALRLRAFLACVAAVAMSLGATSMSLLAQPAPRELQLQCSNTNVGRFEKIEFQLTLTNQYAHPFDPAEVDLRLEVTSPDGSNVTVPAFFGQDYERRRLGGEGRQRDWFYPTGLPGWKARFAPMSLGRYRAVALLKDRHGEARSEPVTFECVPSQSKGFVRVSRKDPRFLEYSEGQPFFAMGQNLAFIGDQQYVSLSKAEQIFARLGENGANYLRVWTCCEDWATAIEARKSAWNRSWAKQTPLVPMPDRPGQRCLLISRNTSAQEVNPPHALTLRPGTKYVISGQVRAEAGVTLQLEAGGAKLGQPEASAPPLSWAPFRQEFTAGPNQYWQGQLRIRRGGNGAAWLSDLSLKEAAGGPELLWEADMNRPTRGFYNPLDCFIVDELVAAAEKRGIGLQLCLLTRDVYMDALKNPGSAEYDRAIADAKNVLRYAVARWGYSTSVAAWEYWNEMNPGLPTDRFYAELGTYLEQVDPYRHLRTTSTWGPSPKDCKHPQLDVADVHFYLRPADKGRLADEVDAVLERTRWLRAQAPNKPAHLGEFGLADDQWRITDEMKRVRELPDIHNALWASALSGASGTALFWWWEHLDERNVYPLYGSLSQFIANVPWNSGTVQPLTGKCSDEQMRVVGLRAGERAWVWLFDPAGAWKYVAVAKQAAPERTGLKLEWDGCMSSKCRVVWWDTHAGKILREDTALPSNGVIRLSVPPFRGDVACRVEP